MEKDDETGGKGFLRKEWDPLSPEKWTVRGSVWSL
jgi:hypothetical protein